MKKLLHAGLLLTQLFLAQGMLNAADRPNSEETSFSETLRKFLPSLKPHRDLFASLAEEGSVELDVLLYSNPLHSVVTVEPDIFDQLANRSVEMCLQFTGRVVPDPDE